MTRRDHDRTDAAKAPGAFGPLLGPARYVTVKGAAAAMGLSEGAVRKRIERGIWVLGKQYRKAPDARIYIDLKAVERWIESGS